MKVLLLNPYDRNAAPISRWPHLWLVLIASVLKTKGHEVVVVDYAYWLNPRYFLKYLYLIRKKRLEGAFFSGLSAAVRINAEMLSHKAGRYSKSRLPRWGTKHRCA